MAFAERLREVSDSATLVMSARAKAMQQAGIEVIDLSAGQPDFPTPANVIAAAQAFLAKGQIKYTATSGIPELRSAMAARYAADCGIALSADNVLVGNGGKHVLYTALQALVNPGDEVLFASPYWVSYPDLARLAGGRPVPIPTSMADGFQLTADMVEAALTDRSRVLILNSPANPTGARLGRAKLEAIVALAAERGLWILSDEIYDRLCYGGEPHRSPLALPAADLERCIAANSLSKTYAMTGWRVGYAVGPTDAIAAMGLVQAHETSNVNSLAQVAALEAITGDQSGVEAQRAVFDGRRRVMVAGLSALPDIECSEPTGAFYCFPRVSSYYGKRLDARSIGGSMDLAMALLEEAHVATVPGIAFGDDDHLRLSYATSTEQIGRALVRLRALLERLD